MADPYYIRAVEALERIADAVERMAPAPAEAKAEEAPVVVVPESEPEKKKKW